MSDEVTEYREQWRRARPDLDPSALATVGRLLRVAALIGDEVDSFASDRGISRSEGDILMTLRRVGSPSLDVQGLAQSLVLTPARLRERLDQLERQRLIARESGGEIELTEKGRDLVDSFLGDHVANEERLLASLTREQRDTLDELLWLVLEPLQARR